jgi:prepilin peptidase CpaA
LIGAPATAAASYGVLVVAATLLFYLAATDLRQFRIRNELILVLMGLFFVHSLLSGRWVEIHWNLGFAGLSFALMLVCYVRGLMGGGDLKLMTVALLWTGPHCALPFLIILVIFASLHALAARLDWVQALRVEGRLKVAFAPSIAAGLIGIFLLGCLRPL